MVKADVVRVYHCPHGVGSFPGGGQAGLHPELQVGKAGEEGSGQRGWGVIQARGGRGGGREGPPPCTSAPGPGTPATSSRTAGGSASCSLCGRCLRGQKENMSAALPGGRGDIRKSLPSAREATSPLSEDN